MAERNHLAHELLNEAIPKDAISKKQNLSYVSGGYVKRNLNRIFASKWSYKVLEMYILDGPTPRVFAHVRIQVKVDDEWITRDGVAIGHGQSKTREGGQLSETRYSEVLDFAAAEAVTDALKRAASTLGEVLGLQLYPDTKGGARKRVSRKRTVRRKR